MKKEEKKEEKKVGGEGLDRRARAALMEARNNRLACRAPWLASEGERKRGGGGKKGGGMKKTTGGYDRQSIFFFWVN